MTTVLLATCADHPAGHHDEAGLVRACAGHGVEAAWAVWDDPSVAWAAADLVVVRSTWDYPARRDEFLAWAASVPRLANPFEVLAYSTDKAYLVDLADRGVPTVPTVVVDGDQQLPWADPRRDLVVKPSVGSGSMGAGRFAPDAAGRAAAEAHAAHLRAHGRTVVVQPYLDGVDTAGESALVYLDGVFSHAVRKGPSLSAPGAHTLPGAGGVTYVDQSIEPRSPSAEERRVAELTLAALPGGGTPLYARIDLLPAPAGPLVTEAELVEPSLFLATEPGSVDRLAAAVAHRAGAV